VSPKPWPGFDGAPTIKVLGIRGQIDNGSLLPGSGSCIYQYELSREARISHRLQEDLQIEPRGPVLDVVEIVRDPGVRLF
jgi:hypothetical protein